MTDPMNDLRQASADVSGVSVLSPAAQAVLNAAHDGANQVIFDIGNDSPVPFCAAAALRAAADQMNYAGAVEAGDWLVAIAAELDGGAQ